MQGTSRQNAECLQVRCQAQGASTTAIWAGVKSQGFNKANLASLFAGCGPSAGQIPKCLISTMHRWPLECACPSLDMSYYPCAEQILEYLKGYGICLVRKFILAWVGIDTDIPLCSLCSADWGLLPGLFLHGKALDSQSHLCRKRSPPCNLRGTGTSACHVCCFGQASDTVISP